MKPENNLKKGDLIMVRNSNLEIWLMYQLHHIHEGKAIVYADHGSRLVEFNEWEIPANTPEPEKRKVVRAFAVIDRDSNDKIIHLCKFKEDAEVLARNVYLHEGFKGSSVIELVEIPKP